MGNLTKNISRFELKCKCGSCRHQAVDFETIKILQETCDHFAEVLGQDKVVLEIHSAARCPTHNASVGGKPESRHLYGDAIDFSIKHIAPSQVYKYLDAKYPDSFGLGSYSTFTHFDTRPWKARW